MRRQARKFFALFAILATTVSLTAQDWAKATLAKSPRHGEFVALKHGDRTVQTFVVYPEISKKAPVILLIHEIFGLSDWAREMADELAAQGFIVVAPDLLSETGPNKGGTDAIAASDVMKAVSGLSADQVTADLDAAADYAKKIPSANGKLFVAGFCWGGGKSFAFATHRHDLSAAFVFYGPPPTDFASITAPVYGFYAENDARISATVPATTEAMKTAGKKYDPVIYPGAGHGFMRAGEDPANTVPGNKTARDAGFKRIVDLINKANAGNAAIHLKPITTKPTLASVAKPKHSAAPVSCHEETPAGKSVAESNMPAMDMGAM